MSIKIHTQIINKIELPIDGAIAVVLKETVLATEPLTITSIDQLKEKFTISNPITGGQPELAVVEYILTNRVPVILVTEVENLAEVTGEFVSIIDPFNHGVDISDVGKLGKSAEEIKDFLTQYPTLPVQVFLELHLDKVDYGEDEGIEDVFTDKVLIGTEQFEIAVGKFVSTFRSQGYVKSDETFYIPASVPLAIMKSKRLLNNTPWIPVAGEETGKVRDAVKLKTSITLKERNVLQAYGANVLDVKRGVGHLYNSQNTLYEHRETDKYNPVIRSHAVSLTMWLKSTLGKDLGKYQFRPNNSKTWAHLRLELDAKLSGLMEVDAIERYQIFTGKSVMTKQDVDKGLLKAYISYKPIGVVRDIEVTLIISDEHITIEEIEGVV